jgi:hypothetical protein
MKNVRLASLLLVLTIVLAVFVVGNIYRYYYYTYHLQKLDYHYATMERTRLIIQDLANESILYSRTNPAIDPLLQSFNIKEKPTNAAAATSTQPSSK